MKKVRRLLSVAGILCLPVIASADDAAAPLTGIAKILDESGITLNGYVSAGYEAGFGEGNDNLEYRTYDSHPDTFTLNQAALTVSYLPTEGFGAMANVMVGRDAKVNSGFFGDSSGDFNVLQAYAQYATGNFTVIGGRFTSLAGYEVIDDSKNANISRSMVFSLVQPFFHTGVRTSYKFSDTITAYVGVNNSAGDFAGGLGNDDNNKQKTAELGLLLTPTKALSIGLYDYYGFDPIANPNDGFNTEDLRTNFLDVTVGYTVSDALSVGLNADWYNVSAHNGPDPSIYGVALYGKYYVLPKVYTAVRGEALRSINSALVAEKADNNLFEGTLTFGYEATKHFTLLAEGRYDGGTHVYVGKVEGEGNAFKQDQGDIAVKAIYKF